LSYIIRRSIDLHLIVIFKIHFLRVILINSTNPSLAWGRWRIV